MIEADRRWCPAARPIECLPIQKKPKRAVAGGRNAGKERGSHRPDTVASQRAVSERRANIRRYAAVALKATPTALSEANNIGGRRLGPSEIGTPCGIALTERPIRLAKEEEGFRAVGPFPPWPV